MVKIILLYLTLVSCGYIIKVLPEPEPKPEPLLQPEKVQQAPPSPAKASVKASSTPAVIDRHEPVLEEEVKKEKEKSLVPLPPKG